MFPFAEKYYLFLADVSISLPKHWLLGKGLMVKRNKQFWPFLSCHPKQQTVKCIWPGCGVHWLNQWFLKPGVIEGFNTPGFRLWYIHPWPIVIAKSMTGGPGCILVVRVGISLKEMDLLTMTHPGEEKRACGDDSPICLLECAEVAPHLMEDELYT